MAEQLSVFPWSELASDAVCSRLSALADVNAPATPHVRQLVGHILSHAGGLPILRGVVDNDRLDQTAVTLLHEAFRHTLCALGATVERRGYDQKIGLLTAIDRVNVNTADAGALEALPVIGPRTADHIVEERSARGPFRSMKELADRISGIGDRNLATLEGRLSFASPESREIEYNRAGFDDCFRLLLNAHALDSAAARLIRALEMVASVCAESPHPATQEKRIREQVLHAENAQQTDEVHLMSGTAYYSAVQALIDETNSSIAVAMFHIAMTDERHPTRAILDALGRARARGVAVRVLVDRDQPSDPYNSEIINKPALEYLKARNIECRSDETRRLLHSKFVLLDGRKVLLGSHNWSAGSYFQFDDASVLIDSQAFANVVAERFEGMWAKGLPA